MRKTSVLALALSICTLTTVSAQGLCNQRPRICINGATCTEGGGALGVTCECQQGFSGERCEIDLDECESNPCKNGATCQNRKGGWTCDCIIGTFGIDCGIIVDPCADDPCDNGNCVQTGATSYECQECPPGFVGNQCVDTDFCAQPDNPCFNGGLCSNNAEKTDYVCNCPPMYTGKNCEVYEGCIQQPCLNQGTCINGVSPAQPYTCTCPPPWYGEVCEKRDPIKRPCDSNPCQNDATCADNGINYKCDCLEGYFGNFCQGVLPCLSNPCENGAECVNSPALTLFSCECPLGFTGETCSVKINACDSSPCQNDAVCTPGDQATYTCTCPAGIQGTNCEEFIDECASNPCQNGGLCNDLLNAYVCSCPVLTTGDNCEEIIELCKGVECPNGRCDVDPQTRTTVCICDPGFIKKGEDCVDINECETGDHTCDPLATCENVDSTYTCTCPSTHVGDGYTCSCGDGTYTDGDKCIACRSPNHCLSEPPATCTGEPAWDAPCPTSECEDGYISTDTSPCKWKMLVGVAKPKDEVDLDKWVDDIKAAIDSPYLDVLGAIDGEFPPKDKATEPPPAAATPDETNPNPNPNPDPGTPVQATDDNGEPVVDDAGNPVMETPAAPDANANANATANPPTTPVDPSDGGEAEQITIMLAAELSEDDTLEDLNSDDYMQEKLGDAGDVAWVLRPEKDDPILFDGTEDNLEEEIDTYIANSESSAVVIDCESAFVNCAECRLTKCVECIERYALNSDQKTCSECPTLHGNHCGKCNLEVCTQCDEGYILDPTTNLCIVDLSLIKKEEGERLQAPPVSYNEKRKRRQAIKLGMKPPPEEVAANAAEEEARVEVKARQARRATGDREAAAQVVMAGAITAVFVVMLF